MSRDTRKVISLLFAIASATAIFACVIFLYMNQEVVRQQNLLVTEPLLSLAVFSFLGTLLTYHRPEKRISWLFLAAAILRHGAIAHPISEIVLARASAPTYWPVWLQVQSSLSTGLAYTLLAYIIVLFPSGSLPSRRWRPVTWLLVVVIVTVVATGFYLSLDLYRVLEQAESNRTTITLTPLVPSSPVGERLYVRAVPAYALVNRLLLALISVILSSGVYALFQRYRTGSYVERQQIKWIFLAVALWAAFAILIVSPAPVPFQLTAVVGLLTPAAIAIAILRYRIFDIDIIIRRTLLYGSLTLLLGMFYFGMVAVLQRLFSLMTDTGSPLVVVLSTLAIAALFAPLRRRIQGLIDRHFYRRKYDAVQTLASFSETLRDEVDPDELRAELLRVVVQTMQPEQAFIWLAEPRSE